MESIYIISLIVSIIFWYLYFGLLYFMNGGSLGRNKYLMPFQCFWEDCKLNYFNGKDKRIEFIKKMIGPRPDKLSSTTGRTKTWYDIDVVNNNLFLECYNDIAQRPYAFWLSFVLVPCVSFFTTEFILKHFI